MKITFSLNSPSLMKSNMSKVHVMYKLYIHDNLPISRYHRQYCINCAIKITK